MLKVEDLKVTFTSRGQKLYAVRGVSFEVQAGEAVGIVGESGCGKSALVQAINKLSTGSVSGKVLFEGEEIQGPSKKIGMVFKDPLSALNPTMKIGEQIIEGLIYHKLAKRKEA